MKLCLFTARFIHREMYFSLKVTSDKCLTCDKVLESNVICLLGIFKIYDNCYRLRNLVTVHAAYDGINGLHEQNLVPDLDFQMWNLFAFLNRITLSIGFT